MRSKSVSVMLGLCTGFVLTHVAACTEELPSCPNPPPYVSGEFNVHTLEKSPPDAFFEMRNLRAVGDAPDLVFTLSYNTPEGEYVSVVLAPPDEDANYGGAN